MSSLRSTRVSLASEKLIILAGLAAIAVAAVLFAVDSQRSVARAAVGSPTPGIATVRNGMAYATGSGYDRYAYVTVGVGDARAAGSLSTTSLVYMSGTSIQTAWSTGVPYADALASGWLLKDSSGNLLRTPFGAYVGDIGSASYQQRFIDNVAALLASNGNEGVFIDDVIATPEGLTGGPFPAKYPTQSTWENAMVGFVAAVGPALRARGFYVLTNAVAFISGNSASDTGQLTADFWRRLAPHVNGLASEYWLQSPVDTSILRASGSASWQQHWDGWAGLVNIAQNAGADFFGVSYGSATSIATMRYGKASFLLNWDGGGGAFVYEMSGDTWNPEWATDVGRPAGAKYVVGVGWRREYTGGTVLVNPSPSASQTFALGGTYTRPDGTTATTVTLAPTSGLVLASTSASGGGGGTTAAPVNLAAPSVAGTTIEGYRLTASAGSWSGSPTGYTYGWQRCKSDGSGCTSILGAGAATYTLTSADAGTTLRVLVIATNAGGSASAQSAVTAIVTIATAPSSGGTVVAPTSPGNGNGNGNGKKRVLAAAETPKLEWEGRLFASASEFRRYLSGRVAWEPFLARHPAVVAAFGIPSVKWNARVFFSRETLRAALATDGVSYARWAKAHRAAAGRLVGPALAPDPPTTIRRALVTWNGIGFTTVDGLRRHLRAKNIDWGRFVASHSAVAKTFEIGQPI